MHGVLGVPGMNYSTLLDRSSDGVRDLSWNGRLANGTLVPPGRYALFLRASAPTGATDSTRLLFEIAHDHPPLEDSIRAPNGSALLPERYPSTAGARDLARGVGLAAIALAIPSLGSRRLGTGGRGFARGSVYRQDGTLVASVAQEGLLRVHAPKG